MILLSINMVRSYLSTLSYIYVSYLVFGQQWKRPAKLHGLDIAAHVWCIIIWWFYTEVTMGIG